MGTAGFPFVFLKNVLLIGLRASGKTSVGNILARATSRRCVDLDNITASLLSCSSAAEALSTHGEAAFRAAEFEALKRSLEESHSVISAGGGTPTAPGAAEHIIAQAVEQDLRVFYLCATVETLSRRLAATDLSTRPSLTGAGVLQEIAALHRKRHDLYVSLADEVIEVDGLTPEQVAAAIAASLAD